MSLLHVTKHNTTVNIHWFLYVSRHMSHRSSNIKHTFPITCAWPTDESWTTRVTTHFSQNTTPHNVQACSDVDRRAIERFVCPPGLNVRVRTTPKRTWCLGNHRRTQAWSLEQGRLSVSIWALLSYRSTGLKKTKKKVKGVGDIRAGVVTHA